MAAKSGQDVTLDVRGNKVEAYIAGTENAGAPGVLVLHAWWGLTPFFKGLCDRIAAEGYVAFAANLYVDKTANTIDEAKTLMDSTRGGGELKEAIALAAVDRLKEAAPGKKLGAVGFSMGAAWSIELSILRPDDFGAAVLFYGAGEGDYTKAKAAFQGHFADPDEYESIEYIRQMEGEMKAAGREVTFYMYPGVSHWFFEDNRPDAYNADASKLAWERTLAFLGEKLKA
jgi:carboxymethylenebutenolidase